VTDTILTGIAAILPLLAAVANAYAAFRARPLIPDLGDNLRELTHIIEEVLSGTYKPMKTLIDKLHREGSFQEVSGEFVVAIDLMEERLSTGHDKVSKWGTLEFNKAIIDAARARLWMAIAMVIALLSAVIQLFVVLSRSS
jgi:hypothetical protein